MLRRISDVRARAAALIIAALVSSAPEAPAGVIAGTVRLVTAPPVRATRQASAYPGRATAIPVSGTMRSRVQDAVVYVDLPRDQALRFAPRDPGSRPRLEQRGQQFVPRVLAVAAGTTVDFPNQDPIYHNVFSLSPARRFDLGKYPQGKTRPVRFDTPGLVNVYCDIHSDMEAFVLVVPHGAFARPSASGTFELPDLPAGRYIVKAWHPDVGEKAQVVEVKPKGSVAVELEL